LSELDSRTHTAPKNSLGDPDMINKVDSENDKPGALRTQSLLSGTLHIPYPSNLGLDNRPPIPEVPFGTSIPASLV